MSLIIEDGTGILGANSYDTLENANAYLEARGFEPVLEPAMILGFSFINAWDYLGERAEALQLPAWPRIGTLAEEKTIPLQVKYAQFEAAALYGAGTDPLSPLERGGQIASETIDVISTSYFPTAPAGTQFPAIEALLAPFLRSAWGNSGSGGMMEGRRG